MTIELTINQNPTLNDLSVSSSGTPTTALTVGPTLVGDAKASNVTELLSLTKIKNGEFVYLLGRNTLGDNGAQILRYSESSEATIDGGFVFPGKGGSLSFDGNNDFDGTEGTGRYIAVDQSVAMPTRFGAYNNYTQQTLTTQALNRAAATGKTIVCTAGDQYLINDTISFTTNNQKIEGHGAYFKKFIDLDYMILLSGDQIHLDSIHVDGNRGNFGTTNKRGEGIRSDGGCNLITNSSVFNMEDDDEANGIRTLGAHCTIAYCLVENAGYACIRPDANSTSILYCELRYTELFKSNPNWYRWINPNSIGQRLLIVGLRTFCDQVCTTVSVFDVQADSNSSGRTVIIDGWEWDHSNWIPGDQEQFMKFEGFQHVQIRNFRSNLPTTLHFATFPTGEEPSSKTVNSFDEATDVITVTSHGFTDGQRIRFTTDGTFPGGIESGVSYWVINSTTDTFQISTVKFGDPVDIDDDPVVSSGTMTVVYLNDAETIIIENSELPGAIGLRENYWKLVTINNCKFNSKSLIRDIDNAHLIEIKNVEVNDPVGGDGIVGSDSEVNGRLVIDGLIWNSLGVNNTYLISPVPTVAGNIVINRLTIREGGAGRVYLSNSNTARMIMTWDGNEMKFNHLMSDYYQEPIKSGHTGSGGSPSRCNANSSNSTISTVQWEPDTGIDKFPNLEGEENQFIRNFDKANYPNVEGWKYLSGVWKEVGYKTFLSGAGSPNGVVTPDYIGQEYLDIIGSWYKAKGVTNTTWVAIS